MLSGELTEQQALEELLYSFEGTGMEDPNAPGKRDKKVTYEEFEQYYSAGT